MKWWKRIFISFIDTTIVNALIIYKSLKPTTTQLSFRKELILDIFKQYKSGFNLSNIENDHEIGRRKSSNCVVCWKEDKRTQSVFYCRGCMKTICPEHFVKLHKCK